VNKNNLPSTDINYIKRLIAEGEHQTLDFKFEINDSRKIAKTFSAFANTEGGKLLVGVKDNGSIAGVRSDEEYYMIEAASNMYCKPTVSFTAKKWQIETKIILEITIPKINEIVYAKDEGNNWWAYTRVNDQNILINRVMLEVWKRKEKVNGTYIEYSKNEKILLSYLSENSDISLSKFIRISKITKYEAEKILINLASLNVIDINISEKGVKYSLKNEK
jgi:predicted HTH transcriptional regulator